MILDQDSRGTGADLWHGFERQRSGKSKRLNTDAAHKTLCLIHTAMLAADRRRVNTNLTKRVWKAPPCERQCGGATWYRLATARREELRTEKITQSAICDFCYFFFADHLPVIWPAKSKSPLIWPSLTVPVIVIAPCGVSRLKLSLFPSHLPLLRVAVP